MDLHSVGVSHPTSNHPESLSSQFVLEGLLRAREKTWEVVEQIQKEIKEGIQEAEASKLALNIFSDFGVSKHWHKPYIRLGPGTTRSFRDPIQPDYRLQPNDPFYIDVGPVWKDPDFELEYEGDAGDTYILGSNPQALKCIETARGMFQDIQTRYHQEQMSGVEIYKRLKELAEENKYELIENVDGHRLSDFPHHKYTKERLAHLPSKPKSGFWILEIQIKSTSLNVGAFYEDLLIHSINKNTSSIVTE